MDDLRVFWGGLAVATAALCFVPSASAQHKVRISPVEPGRLSQAPVVVPWVSAVATAPWGDPIAACQKTSTYTDANFEGGSYTAQQGFAQGETAACSYSVAPGEYPIRLDLTEMIFVTTGAVEETVTEWSILIFDGLPNSGPPLAEFSSLDGDLPQIVLGPGTQGVNVQFMVDPNDPDQIILTNSKGQNAFSIGYRIDKHNNPPNDPCDPPSKNSNLFPTTDTSGLFSQSGNWINAIFCAGGCPSGWKTFSQLGFCKPSGDWVMRATWTSLNCQGEVGGCCLPDGSCIVTAKADCSSKGGAYKGDGTDCSTPCVGACCFAGGGCLNLSKADCSSAGGAWLGPGSSCAAGNKCPTGACCLPDGGCTDGVTITQCEALGGTFQGVGTTCANTECPKPTGACCLESGGCLALTEADCSVIPKALWQGAFTTCADQNGNGQADACEKGCYPDCDQSGGLDIDDFICFQTAFAFKDPYADCDTSGEHDVDDFICFQTAYGLGCP